MSQPPSPACRSLRLARKFVRQQIKRLQKDGLIQFTVVTDFRVVDSPNL